jgi:tRNA/tmRNA/rRNA uracil-C5-methylase (TrmA/RlmC/RlmD family)
MKTDVKKDENTPTYWDQYYADRRVGGVPSQFAAFVLSEFADRSKFVDFGCGNGRDAFFFAAHDKKVMGVDGSTSAISGCTSQAEQVGLTNLSF